MRFLGLRRVALILHGLVAASAFAAPEFIGVLVSQGKTYVAVRVVEGERTSWAGIGEMAGDFRVVGYEAKGETLLLTRGGVEYCIALKSATVQSAPTSEFLQSLVKKGDVAMEAILRELMALESRRDKTAG